MANLTILEPVSLVNVDFDQLANLADPHCPRCFGTGLAPELIGVTVPLCGGVDIGWPTGNLIPCSCVEQGGLA